MTALAGIACALGLDHVGIDFGIGTDDTVFVVVANALIGLTWPENDERSTHRRDAVRTILAATERLLRRKTVASAGAVHDLGGPIG
jgi:hypothetical protein